MKSALEQCVDDTVSMSLLPTSIDHFLLNDAIQIANTTWRKKLNLWPFFFNEKILSDLVISSNKIFKRFQKNGAISEKEMKYFLYDYKSATNLGIIFSD